MSRQKIKTEEATEVYVARSKLDGVLQTLVDQKEDGVTPEKDLNHPDSDSELFDSPLSSPAKKSPRVGRLQRKRKLIKEESSPLDNPSNDPCLMKLFDRTVDLAPFVEETPLYPICRAWIRNQHYPGMPERSNQNVDIEALGPLIYELPEPTIIKSENGDVISARIPSPIKQEDERFFINQDSSQVEPETLFLNHMVRWKKVRQKWKRASRDNEMSYIESYNVLREMFDRFAREN